MISADPRYCPSEKVTAGDCERWCYFSGHPRHGGPIPKIRQFRFGRALILLLTLALTSLYPQQMRDEKSTGRTIHPVFRQDLSRFLQGAAYRKAAGFIKTHRRLIRNRKYVTIIDFTRPSYEKRLFILDMETFTLEKHLAAHGKNSGKIYARKFSNEFDSFKSSMGFFLTGEKYVGKHGTTLVLKGLEPGLNDNSVQRGIVLHGAPYVSYKSVFLNGGRLGRSEGCPAVPLLEAPAIVEKIQGGSLLYIHAPAS